MTEIFRRILMHPATLPALIFFIIEAYKKITKKNEL